MKKLKLTIEGMHCASCSGNVDKSLRKVDGVKDVTISLMTKKGFVEVEDDVKESDLSDAVSKVGYKVIEIKEA
jgi:copper chaperone CopZ